jgi:hypothetical protein
MSDALNWNRYEGSASDNPATPPDDTKGGFKGNLFNGVFVENASLIAGAVCGGTFSYMPNAAVTLDRFWLSQNPHQPDILTAFLRGVLPNQTITCPAP